MMPTPSSYLAWVAGENSGDYLASLVLPQVARALGDLSMQGIGGDKMIASGLQAWHHSSALSVRGYVEVIKHLPRILKMRKEVMTRVIAEKPLAYIGVDAPDFNLSIEEKVRSSGISVVHMVAPAIWAWRPQRIHQIRRAIDHLLLVFPFEEALFKKEGIKATYIGHPLANVIPMEPDTVKARALLGLSEKKTVVAVLPGSRKDEIRWCGPAFFGACDLLLKRDSTIRFIVPAADLERRTEIERLLSTFPAVKEATTVTEGASHLVMEASDAVLVASGTATLEAALFKKPLVVGYAMPAISALMIQSKGQTQWISLPNILASRRLVPECLQMFCTAEILASHVLNALEPKTAQKLVPIFTDMHASLLRDTGTLAAEAIVATVNKK